MKKLFSLLLLASAAAVWAQTNAPAKKPLPPTEISADRAVFDNNTRRIIYTGNVLVSDPRLKLRCAQLTVDLPPQGRPTNIVADTGVVIDFVDGGATNHVTADRAVYAFVVSGGVTNETVTFTGNPLVESPQGVISSEPLVWDRSANTFRFTKYKMILPQNLTGGSNSPTKLF